MSAPTPVPKGYVAVDDVIRSTAKAMYFRRANRVFWMPKTRIVKYNQKYWCPEDMAKNNSENESGRIFKTEQEAIHYALSGGLPGPVVRGVDTPVWEARTALYEAYQSLRNTHGEEQTDFQKGVMHALRQLDRPLKQAAAAYRGAMPDPE